MASIVHNINHIISSTLLFCFCQSSYHPVQSQNVGVFVILILFDRIFFQLFQLLHMASTSANIDPMNNILKLTLNNIIDSYFEKDEADFNILNESNIDSLYYGIDDLHKCDVVKRSHNICSMHLNIRSLPDKFDKLKLLLSQLDNVNVNIDFILICETYLT